MSQEAKIESVETHCPSYEEAMEDAIVSLVRALYRSAAPNADTGKLRKVQIPDEELPVFEEVVNFLRDQVDTHKREQTV